MLKFLSALAVVGALTGGFVMNAVAEDKVEKKCDKSGKECKDGADCKAENCKKS